MTWADAPPGGGRGSDGLSGGGLPACCRRRAAVDRGGCVVKWLAGLMSGGNAHEFLAGLATAHSSKILISSLLSSKQNTNLSNTDFLPKISNPIPK